MQSARDVSEGLPGHFTGYDGDSMQVLRLLSVAGAAYGVRGIVPVPQHMMGCSCGSCLEGWLSPRMRHRSAACYPVPNVYIVV